MTLSQEVESCDNMDKEKYNMFLLKYDNLAHDCLFEEIPHGFKRAASKLMKKLLCFLEKRRKKIAVLMYSISLETFE